MHTIDFESMTDAQRLVLVECMLGLLPSNQNWEDRAVFAAFLIAGERGNDAIENAVSGLERLKPGYFDECVRFARELKGEDLLRPETRSASPFEGHHAA